MPGERFLTAHLTLCGACRDRLFSEPRAGIRPCRREPLFMPPKPALTKAPVIGRVGWILLKKSLSRIREEYSVLGQFICARMIRIGYVARTIISQNRLYFAKFRLFQQYRWIADFR
jgi:hypothetical protein